MGKIWCQWLYWGLKNRPKSIGDVISVVKCILIELRSVIFGMGMRQINLCSDNIWAASWQKQQSDCAPSEDSDQPGHPHSLIRVFAVRIKKASVLSYALSAQRRLLSDWVDAQADLSLRWAHTHFVGFVMSRLICIYCLRLLITCSVLRCPAF